jgi:hypothetical protein
MTGTIERNFAPLTIGSLAERSAFWLGVAAQHGAATTQTPREATGRWRWERSKPPARLAVRDHHRRSLCGKSSAQSEQWYCWIGRRRIISASAENRGNSCQRKHKEEERRERYIGGVTALYDRGRDIALVAMTATLEPGTRAKTPQISPIPCSAARRPLGRSRRARSSARACRRFPPRHLT